MIQKVNREWTFNDKELEDFKQDFSHLGIPDVLVTNYSMLEYMLLRPLEHIFWEDTKKWLHGPVNEGEPPRKLLLVLDEAHLYQGAMGTEVSMLLNRLKSVLADGDKEAPIHYILTSASLGSEEDAKRFTREITNLPSNEKIRAPQSTKKKYFQDLDANDLPLISDNLIEKLSNLEKNPILISNEFLLLKELTDLSDSEISKFSRELENIDEKKSSELRYKLISNCSLFKRLYTFLHHPQDFSDFSDETGSPPPRSLEEISKKLFNSESEISIKASERFLDLIASARSWNNSNDEGRPLMPVRAHFFGRGSPRLSICISCSRIHQLGVLKCRQKSDGTSCGGRNYELEVDRNTGEAFVTIWLKKPQFGVLNARGEKATYQLEGPDDADEILEGLTSLRVKSDHPKVTHRLNKKSGVLKWHEDIDENDPDWISLIVPGFKSSLKGNNFSWDKTECWQDRNNSDSQRKWHEKIQSLTEKDYGRRWINQVNDMETRGDDAFSTIIHSLISSQDPVSALKNSPNKGKKCLIFSDSRQQAAKLALRLGNLSFNDESRKLLFYLLHQKWFKSLPRELRSLSKLYPWFSLMSSSLMANPFDDSSGKNNRSLFALHQMEFMSLFLAQMIVSEGQLKNSALSILNKFELCEISEDFDYKTYGALEKVVRHCERESRSYWDSDETKFKKNFYSFLLKNLEKKSLPNFYQELEYLKQNKFSEAK